MKVFDLLTFSKGTAMWVSNVLKMYLRRCFGVNLKANDLLLEKDPCIARLGNCKDFSGCVTLQNYSPV